MPVCPVITMFQQTLNRNYRTIGYKSSTPKKVEKREIELNSFYITIKGENMRIEKLFENNRILVEVQNFAFQLLKFCIY